MGIVQSVLLVLAGACWAAWVFLRDASQVLRRAKAPASLPNANSTAPFWLRNPPYPKLGHIHSEELPTEADIVIIGSGITAASTALSTLYWMKQRNLIGLEYGPNIVVLEARELCSGATGRNGGHIKVSPHEQMRMLLDKGLSGERAAELVRFQLHSMNLLMNLCGKADLEHVAQCRRVETVDLYFDDEKGFEKAVEGVDLVRKWIPEFISEFEMRLCTAEEAVKEFSASKQVLGAITYQAGAIWPNRFVTAIWNMLLSDFGESITIETHTPATEIIMVNDGAAHHPFEVVTPRGSIRARHVVHATNAYTTNLVPGLCGKMTGLLAHMSAQRPARAFEPGVKYGARSWGVMFGGSGDFDYITQVETARASGLPSSELMVGGGFTRSGKQGMDMVGVYDDSRLDFHTVAHISGVVRTAFDSPPLFSSTETSRMNVWSGVVCYTADRLPLVGRLDERTTGRRIPSPRRLFRRGGGSGGFVGDRPGEWISAGYNGDGMVWAWLCGMALGRMIVGNDVIRAGGGEYIEPERKTDNAAFDFDSDAVYRMTRILDGMPGDLNKWFPAELYSSYERTKKMNIINLASELV